MCTYNALQVPAKRSILKIQKMKEAVFGMGSQELIVLEPNGLKVSFAWRLIRATYVYRPIKMNLQ